MTDIHRRKQSFVNFDDGDCIADPVPALWHQDDDYLVESGLIERYWVPLSLGVLAAWGSLSYFLVNAFGWFALLAIAGIVFAGATAAVFLVKTGERGRQAETGATSIDEQQDSGFSKAA
jgi:hypothetical protein